MINANVSVYLIFVVVYWFYLERDIDKGACQQGAFVFTS